MPKIMNMSSEIFHRLVLVLHFWSKLWRLHWPLQSRALTWDHMFVGSSINLKNLSVLGTKMQNNISFLWKTNKKSLVLQVRFLFTFLNLSCFSLENKVSFLTTKGYFYLLTFPVQSYPPTHSHMHTYIMHIHKNRIKGGVMFFKSQLILNLWV